MDKNEVKLSGMIVSEPQFSHMRDGKAVYKTKMEVVRESGNTDLIPININIDLMRKVQVVENDAYFVKGKFVSFNKNGKLILSVDVEEIDHCDLQPIDLNIIAFTGYICKNVVCRVTPLGKKIADLMIATNGERYSSYLPCIVWHHNCDIVKDMAVGTKVECVGRLQSREYDKMLANGTIERRTAYEVSLHYIKEIGE